MTTGPGSAPPRQSRTMEIATFTLGEDLMGIPIDQVDEIHHPLDLTPVPHAPSYVRGVMNLRGEVVTVIDLRVILGLEPAVLTRRTCNVVVRWGGERVGLLVDRIGDVVSAAQETIEPPPANIAERHGRFLRGLCKLETGVLAILDIEQLLSEDEESASPHGSDRAMSRRGGPPSPRKIPAT